jgi:hypothetical protein
MKTPKRKRPRGPAPSSTFAEQLCETVDAVRCAHHSSGAA